MPPNPPFGPSAARPRWKNHRKERSTKDLRASNIHGKDGRATHSLFPFRFLFSTLRSKETLGCCPNPPEGLHPSDSHLRFARMKLTSLSPHIANQRAVRSITPDSPFFFLYTFIRSCTFPWRFPRSPPHTGRKPWTPSAGRPRKSRSNPPC